MLFPGFCTLLNNCACQGPAPISILTKPRKMSKHDPKHNTAVQAVAVSYFLPRPPSNQFMLWKPLIFLYTTSSGNIWKTVQPFHSPANLSHCLHYQPLLDSLVIVFEALPGPQCPAYPVVVHVGNWWAPQLHLHPLGYIVGNATEIPYFA